MRLSDGAISNLGSENLWLGKGSGPVRCMQPMVRSTLGVLLVAAHVSVGFSEVRGDRTCWSVGFDFETCCGKAFGPFGSPKCWDYFPRDVAGYYSYQRCCGNDPVWSHQFREIQVEPLPRRDARELVPRFGLKQIAQMVEYFLISLMRSDLRGGQSEPTCKRLHLLSDFLYLAGELQATDISGACFIAFYESDDELMEALTAIQDGGGSFIGPNLVATSANQGSSDGVRFLWVNSHLVAVSVFYILLLLVVAVICCCFVKFILVLSPKCIQGHAVAATHDTLAYEWGKSGSQLTGGKTFGKMSGLVAVGVIVIFIVARFFCCCLSLLMSFLF
ncbi:unnamed protein product [Polarella glacialis]|uniref:Uncharacterized protein n=1 Tax=Polarella glacialis TaxID=89957 RepID=A0A813LAX5_POLGL|nr:unnamed protein product [Polarella glacialis]